MFLGLAEIRAKQIKKQYEERLKLARERGEEIEEPSESSSSDESENEESLSENEDLQNGNEDSQNGNEDSRIIEDKQVKNGSIIRESTENIESLLINGLNIIEKDTPLKDEDTPPPLEDGIITQVYHVHVLTHYDYINYYAVG